MLLSKGISKYHAGGGGSEGGVWGQNVVEGKQADRIYQLLGWFIEIIRRVEF